MISSRLLFVCIGPGVLLANAPRLEPIQVLSRIEKVQVVKYLLVVAHWTCCVRRF